MKHYNNSVWDACRKAWGQRTVHKAYHSNFKIVRADTYELKKLAYKLRYEVYIEENAREDIQDKATQLEKDIYDAHSEHVLMIHKPTKKLAGCVRVVLPNKDNPHHSFPLQEYCDHPFLHMEKNSQQFCQISRLCVAKDFRRRWEDGSYLPGFFSPDDPENARLKRHIPFSPLGLIGEAFNIALENRIKDCVWMLDDRQMDVIRQLGIIYKTLGPRLDISGKWQPFVFNIKHTLENIVFENPTCADVLTNQGATLKLAHALERDLWHDDVFDTECHERLFEMMHARLKTNQA